MAGHVSPSTPEPSPPQARRVGITRPFRRADGLAAGTIRGGLAGPAYRRRFEEEAVRD